MRKLSVNYYRIGSVVRIETNELSKGSEAMEASLRTGVEVIDRISVGPE